MENTQSDASVYGSQSSLLDPCCNMLVRVYPAHKGWVEIPRLTCCFQPVQISVGSRHILMAADQSLLFIVLTTQIHLFSVRMIVDVECYSPGMDVIERVQRSDKDCGKRTVSTWLVLDSKCRVPEPGESKCETQLADISHMTGN